MNVAAKSLAIVLCLLCSACAGRQGAVDNRPVQPARRGWHINHDVTAGQTRLQFGPFLVDQAVATSAGADNFTFKLADGAGGRWFGSCRAPALAGAPLSPFTPIRTKSTVALMCTLLDARAALTWRMTIDMADGWNGVLFAAGERISVTRNGRAFSFTDGPHNLGTVDLDRGARFALDTADPLTRGGVAASAAALLVMHALRYDVVTALR